MRTEPEKQRRNVVQYFGPYTKENVAALKEQAASGSIRYYLRRDRKRRRLPGAPSRCEGGILFGYIEGAIRHCKGGWGKQFFAVRAKYGVKEVLVLTPLPLDPARHTDGKGFCSDPYVSDESASNLLEDLIEINIEKGCELKRIEAAWARREL